MVDLDVLKSKGVTSDRMKEIFTASAKLTKGVKSKDQIAQERIKNRIRDRVWSGIQWNLSNYKYWHACDLAWDVPFRQTTYSLLKGLMDRKTPSKEILSALDNVDLSEMVTMFDKSGKVLSGRPDPQSIAEVKIDAPTFFQIYLPLAKSYTTIRAAAIVNSYRQIPFFKYEAAKSTAINRTKSDIITDRIEMMSTQYGMYDVLKQAVLSMLHYSFALLFPVEEWHSEMQTLRVPVTDAKGNIVPGKTELKDTTVKEGMRYNIPHPSRVFLDAAYRPSTINSDTGVRFGAYWSVVRIGEIMGNSKYWNNENVPDNGRDLKTDNPTFFNTVYSSCALRFGPKGTTDRNDREVRLSFYTANEPDRAITLTEYFEKINPKHEGIGDYEGEVWFRYVVAGDDTVVYATPLPYNPMVYFGYDALETRAQNASMTLEILPFQDHISNLITQYLLTVKQNLSNITFFDTNQVDKDVIEQIRNLGHKNYTANNYVPMDMRTNRIGQNNPAQAFQTMELTKTSTDDLVRGVHELLTILERVLVISPQELAQTASHELTAEEVKNMNAGKSTRYEFTAGSVDRAVYALKVQMYNALMAYGDEDIWARLPMPIDAESLTQLGFTVHQNDKHGKTSLVTGKKSAIFVESFAANRDGDLRVANTATAQTMTQVLQAVMSNPALFTELGAPQVINLINEISQIAGLPTDFKFTSTGALEQQQQAQSQAGQQQQQAQQIQMMQQKLQQMAQQIEQQAAQQAAQAVGQQVAPELQKQAAELQQLAAEVQKIASQVPTQLPPQPNDPQNIPSPPPGSGAGQNPGMAGQPPSQGFPPGS